MRSSPLVSLHHDLKVLNLLPLHSHEDHCIMAAPAYRGDKLTQPSRLAGQPPGALLLCEKGGNIVNGALTTTV